MSNIFEFKPAPSPQFIDMVEIEVSDKAGLSMRAHLPWSAYLSICRIARAANDDPREHIAALAKLDLEAIPARLHSQEKPQE